MSTAADLPLEDRARLLTGADFWTTAAAPGVPSIVLTDGPHGVRRQVGDSDHLGLNAAAPATCFPPAVAVGSSWNPDLARRIGGAVAAEARALGVAVVLGPGVNIKRHPLCGRNFEYYSEDPLLAGALGSAQVQGLQDGGAGASVKHFALNNQETERMRVSVDADPRTVREIYLPAFERIVTDASPATVMCSYNRIDGVHASENSWLLTTVLRDEWGYDGLVVSDWGAVRDPVAAVRAGLDLEMPHGPHSTARIVAAVRSGELDEAVVTRAAQRVIDLTRWAPSDDEPAPDLDAHHALAREAAAECAVLLRNENAALPLDAAAGTVAVIGELARTPRYQGGGSSHINATRVDVPLDEIAARGSDLGVAVEFAAGYGIGDDADDTALRDEAVAAAARSGVAVVFAGLTEAEESEGFDRPDLAIDPQQVELLRAVAAAAPRTVVVLVGGGVIELEPWHDEVDAILEAFLLGQGGGAAIADLLFGLAEPSGRLAETIPHRLEQTPAFGNFPGELGTVRYGEGLLVGYRWYTTRKIAPRYPFGHGLGYTSFTIEDLVVEVTGADTATASVLVTNTGDRAGSHVVQLYVGGGPGSVFRPRRSLAAFRKVELDPGASTTVALDLPRRAFAHWDTPRGDWVVSPGDYPIEVGGSSADIDGAATVTLDGDVIVEPLGMESTIAEWAAHPVAGEGFRTALAGSAGGMPVDQLLELAGSMPLGKALDMLPGPAGDEARAQLEAVIAGQ
ncbi:Thermostable beta-glucosidase B (plasmid) [Tsukamurella tyrosinosolvens]|uniref:Exo-alpha-(1->6)-L-arabinopyranosidase n=1 Tax=Tsukamurella tyrosinosolvens TaxID=57704 RepID=A0A1H4R1I4_TSUTY|nr:glycoside hydrolase family 3 C-terminal domain-containing protein [Tsukamurella tyrosinosolvens]KXO91434.1 glycosyl hydrolase [Tsukamurella tyrosinosolvens]SEC25772.1 beta-glucosidase [Tsukamurella tyrosinosolvens]VEH92310.1 Thermostable beta-glucosidase B [Tsukamurella tyrosinosolvens]